MMPPVPIIGSAMKAGMVSAPSRAISFSNSSAQYAANCVSLMPAGAWRYQCGQIVCLTQSIGKSKCWWKPGRAGQTAGHDAGAVVAAVPRDDLFLVPASEHVVVVPDDLDLRLVGVRPRHAVIHLLHARRRPVDDARR